MKTDSEIVRDVLRTDEPQLYKADLERIAAQLEAAPKLLQAAQAVVAAGWDDDAPEGEEIDMDALQAKIEELRNAIKEAGV